MKIEEMDVKDLVIRINQITIEQQKLEIEYNQIVAELWKRIPSLKNDVNLQPKNKMKEKKLIINKK